ncbi:MAG: transcription termination factor NusA [Mycoplasmataceae bacterium]|nr:transcription termination factor NusA [Mycoplasmataceae bacterium]
MSEEFKIEDFFSAIKQVAEQNLLEEKEIYSIITESIEKSFQSKFDPDAELEIIIDPVKLKFEVINKGKFVVDEEVPEEYRAIEINIKDAKKLDDKVKVGGTVAETVNFNAYSRAVAQQIRQLITQTVREMKKKAIYIKHKSLKDEMVSATVTSLGPNFAVLVLEDGTMAFMPPKLKNPNIKLRVGERVKVYVEDVLEESKDAQIIVSNGSKHVVKRLLEVEVPEVAEGIIEVVSISRLPGERTKVAVKSIDENVDATGAIIGARGSRITSIVEKLQGEKIDIIQYSDDKNTFIVNALSPAKVVSISDKLDEEGKVIEGHKVIITPNRHQTLAIGKRGSNARLAVELTNSRIDILSIDDAKERGIAILWNGNVKEEQLSDIEEGVRQQRAPRGNGRGNTERTGFNTGASSYDATDDINSFNESIEFSSFESTPESFSDSDYNLGEEFSDEDLQKMQADFEFDGEIGDLDLGNVDFGLDDSK